MTNTPNDVLAVQTVAEIGPNLLDSVKRLNALFEGRTSLEVREGMAAGTHTKRSFVLDLSLLLAEEQRRYEGSAPGKPTVGLLEAAAALLDSAREVSG